MGPRPHTFRHSRRIRAPPTCCLPTAAELADPEAETIMRSAAGPGSSRDGLTANDRFKLRVRRYKWAAAVLAVIIHVLAFMLIPPFRAEGVTLRMVVDVGGWETPSSVQLPSADYVAFDSAMATPVLRNGADLDRRLPRLYPWLLWHHREPSSVLVQVAVAPTGEVRGLRLLESEGSTAQAALLELAGRMKLVLQEGSGGIVANVRVSVVEP